MPGMSLVCDACKDLTAEQCEHQKMCARCGVSLAERAAAKRGMMAPRSSDYTAFPGEDDFVRALFVVNEGAALTHYASDLLAYVKGQLEVIQAIVSFAGDEWDKLGVVGFATGSFDLMWLMRERIGARLPNRIRITRGLAHKEQSADTAADDAFYKILDQFESLGVSRLVLVDEVDSGGQMNAALKRTSKWLKRNGQRHMHALALGMSESDNPEVEKAIMKRKWTSVKVIRVPVLLAMDDAGAQIKPVMSAPDRTRYVPYRSWPGIYRVRCKNTLTSCSFRDVEASGSTSDAYSSTVRTICIDNPDRPKLNWPEKSCEECAKKVAEIRALAAMLPTNDKEGVVVGTVAERRERMKKIVLTGQDP